MKIKKYIQAIKKFIRVTKIKVSIFIDNRLYPLPSMFKDPDLFEKAFTERVMRILRPSERDIRKATAKYNRGMAIIEAGGELPEDGKY